MADEYVYQGLDANMCLLQEEIVASELGVWLEGIVAFKGDVTISFGVTLDSGQVDVLDGIVGGHDPDGVCGAEAGVGLGSLMWQGEWFDGVAYGVGSVVLLDGSSFVALVDVEAGVVPGVGVEWLLLAAAGEVGADGDDVVKLAGDQTVAGVKTLSNHLTMSTNADVVLSDTSEVRWSDVIISRTAANTISLATGDKLQQGSLATVPADLVNFQSMRNSRKETTSFSGDIAAMSLTADHWHVYTGSGGHTVTLSTGVNDSFWILHRGTGALTVRAGTGGTLNGISNPAGVVLYPGDCVAILGTAINTSIATWFERAPVFAEMSRTTSQSLTTGVAAKVLFNTSVQESTSGMVSTANSRITVPVDGWYHVNVHLSHGSGATARRGRLMIDGTASDLHSFQDTGAVNWLAYSTVVRLSSGQYVEYEALHTSGGLTLHTTGSGSRFRVVKISN